jgi:hypothetical protein
MPPSVHVLPAQTLSLDDWSDLFSAASIGEANLMTHLSQHRIGIRSEFGATDPEACAVVLGLARHELQHARQYGGPNRKELHALDKIADSIARANDGAHSTSFYRLKPTELDANAAAASLVRNALPDVVEQLATSSRWRPLVDVWPTIDARDLPTLTVRYIAEHGETLDRRKVFGSKRSLEALVEDAYPGAWRTAYP